MGLAHAEINRERTSRKRELLREYPWAFEWREGERQSWEESLGPER